MSKPVIHWLIVKRGPFGGTLRTSLCRRLANLADMNIAVERDEVTCKLCRRMLEKEASS